MNYQEIIDHFNALANPEIAVKSLRFIKAGKGEYGYGDKFLGVRVPVIRLAVKKYQSTPLITAEKLLHSEFHEIRLFALILMVSQFSKSDAEQQGKIFNTYLENTQYINNWDLVDTSAHRIVGPYLENKDRAILYKLAESDSLWERRISILSTFHFIRKNDFKDTLSLSKVLLNDHEDLMHKAVGWMLREVGNRSLKDEVTFLKMHYQTMPRTMLRYAIEKFSKVERQQYLKGEI